MRARTYNFIFVGVVCALIALTLSSALMLSIAVCMGVMLLLSLASAVAAYVSVKVAVDARRLNVPRGQKVEGGVGLRFVSVLPLGSVAFVSDTGRTLRFGTFPFVRYVKKLAVDTLHVGVFPWGGGKVYLTDVFNLFVFSRRVDAGDAFITVLPRAFETEKPENHAREADIGEIRLSDDADQPSGIRDWAEGDLLKRVHWKLTMKNYDPVQQSVKPLVKTYEEAVRPDILVLPDLTGVEALDERAFLLRDGVCEAALSLCKAVVEGKETVSLLLCNGDTREIKASSPEGLSEIALSLARERFDAMIAFESLVSEAMRRVGTTLTAVFVTTRLNERDADMLMRLRSFSGMNVAAMFVTDVLTTRASLIQARLEAGGIPVRLCIPGGKEGSA